MSFLSKVSSFSVGLIFSGALSFTILESIRDRRCSFIKDKNNDKIQQLIYTAKLKELINSAEIQQYRMNDLETQLVEKSRTFTRFFLLNYQTVLLSLSLLLYYFIDTNL